MTEKVFIRNKFLDSLKDCEELTEKVQKLNTEKLSPELKAFVLGYIRGCNDYAESITKYFTPYLQENYESIR
jgi:hypothetical protein